MSSSQKLSVFLPFYNEEEIIKENVSKIIKKLEELDRKFDIFLVDDSSKDNSSKAAKELTKDKRIHYLFFGNGPSRRENLGKSFLNSKNPLILFMDIDLATDLEYLKPLITEVENGYDIAIGSRYSGIRAKRELHRKILSYLYNNTIKILFNSKIDDHQCGFKSFRREKLLELLNEMGYDDTFTRGWFWDAELLIRAQRKNFRIKVIPVRWNFAKQSSFNLSRELKVIKYMLKLRWEMI